MDDKIKELFSVWDKHNISGFYCENKDQALKKVLELVPQAASVGFSGSVTLNEIAAIDNLKSRGNRVLDPYLAGLSREEVMQTRQEATLADYYLASANAISSKGELVFFSAFGNRISGVSNAKNVIIIAGVNKITPDLGEALKRAREYATPLNCRRLNWKTPCLPDGICRKEICLFPEYERMCCQVLIIEADVNPDRLKVILVGEKLGF
ncbi:MAG: lactate utilization protein [Candidatus Omnitrophica bacterium]|nr:lactate utilization protein [Candidatus Omnitrophota bacterium]